MLKLGGRFMLDKQIKVIFLVDGFVFETIDSAKKFINERIYIEAEKDSNSPSMKGRDN